MNASGFVSPGVQGGPEVSRGSKKRGPEVSSGVQGGLGGSGGVQGGPEGSEVSRWVQMGPEGSRTYVPCPSNILESCHAHEAELVAVQ